MSSNGGILQLVATGIQNNNCKNIASQDFRNIPFSIKWNDTESILIKRVGDIINTFSISMKMGPAPPGYRWKQRWPYFFLKSFVLKIGEVPYWTIHSETLQMQYLIHGAKESAECIFDYDANERTVRSKASHNICFQLIRLEDILPFSKIPLITLTQELPKLELETASLSDCLEPIANTFQSTDLDDEILKYQNTILQDTSIIVSRIFLDHAERSDLKKLENTRNSYSSYHYDYKTFHISSKEKLQHKLLLDDIQNICSTAYIWVTDMSGNEIPQQAVKTIEVFTHGSSRHTLDGFQSRYLPSNQLAHSVVPNDKSKNLYYISYYAGRKGKDGVEYGYNLSRVDNYRIVIDLYKGISSDKLIIHVVHRIQKPILFYKGKVSYRYQSIQTSEEGQRHLTKVFNFKQEIPIQTKITKTEVLSDSEVTIITTLKHRCGLTKNEIENGYPIAHCNGCKTYYEADAILDWIEKNEKKCPKCSIPYDSPDFLKGLAKFEN